ncbi:uncharacterized protein [Halyomorpha halys]|uniref:uncharacterized protein n=1 Tax=Halyomorpha halys TaxID=286706 RepID=UPI0034D18935
MTKKIPEDIKIQFEKLKEKLSFYVSQIKTFISQGRGIAKEPEKLFLFKGMYSELKPCFISFCETYDSLKDLCSGSNVSDLFPTKEDSSLFKTMEDYYYEGCAIYQNYMNPTPETAASSAELSTLLNAARIDESRVVRARLPQINLPDFSGDSTEWPLFRDTFSALIHNEPALSDMEKFLFLTSCLKGTARSLISNVSLTADNYHQAWNLLKTHFDNRRKLANTYLQQVLDYKSVSGRPTIESFKSLISSVVENIESLKLLKIWMIFFFRFETNNKGRGATGKPQCPETSKRLDDSLACPICKLSHALYQCERFRKATIPDKRSFRNNWLGCTNCLSSRHQLSNCSSMRSCGLCNQNHHTWIHQLDHEEIAHPQPELTNPVSLGTISGGGEVLLGTAVAEVQSAQGLFLPIRLVTDNGSQHSFMTTECAKRLGLTIEPCDQTITGRVVERHYQKTHYRLSSGRYVVSLTVKENISSLQNPEYQALKRLYNLENKLNKNPSLKEQYHLFMKEYLDHGHIRLVPPGVITRYTIPHHPVFKEQDGKIKIRVVFDASCRTVTGSLNDRLYVGPKLQNDISELISQFRTHRIAFTTDIVKIELIELMTSGGFELSKWASNISKLLNQFEEVQCQTAAVALSSSEAPMIKLLGMQWIQSSDVFTYEITPPPRIFTKRAILSAIARIYDPLGFLSPTVFYAKTILQDAWKSSCGWDESVLPQLRLRWLEFLEHLQDIPTVRIPRCFIPVGGVPYMIVGFCDASQRGYSAVIYILTSIDEINYAYLLKAKTKLAPIKLMTIPRLELSAALLLCRLFNSCHKVITRLELREAHFFTDSNVVLGWLRTPTERMNAFVAHRVVQILEITDRSQWGHVKSEENPADCSSRGLLPIELIKHNLWWNGPAWLKYSKDKWPDSFIQEEYLPEIKLNSRESFVTVSTETPHLITWMERFSSYPKLIRCTCYVLRFLKRTRHQPGTSGAFTLKDTREANIALLRVVQRHLKIDKRHLQSLNAFLGDDGLLRVGGRLQHSHLSYNAKHPIIISGKSQFTKILIDHYHLVNMHMGPTALQV